ncbi:arylsulfatase [Ravibacter arvi]|uniref:Arylsulfatase n=1 Tax=Ravibacter arvi TaxID=2051041 RepID=A0ABP8LKV6_9BACT
MKHDVAFFYASCLLTAVLFPQIPAAGGPLVSSDSRPNIIYIMADDMGYSDLGCYGGEIRTPNLDRLASNGIKFRSFYNNARCCPTRASLLTGRYPHEAGMGHMVTPDGAEVKPGPYQGFIDNRYPTIAEYLKQGGYRTYMAGKWHVGERPEHWPLRRGFDHFFGLINGATGYYGVIPQEKGKRHIVLEDKEFGTSAEGFYITDAFTDHAIRYLNKHNKENPKAPFFLYLAYTAPHFPLHAPEEDVAPYEKVYSDGWDVIRERRYKKMTSLGLADKRFSFLSRPANIPSWESADNKDEWVRKMAVYAAMIDRMDRNIGKLLAQLKANGQLDNTLIIFLSDNGACAENVARRNFNDPTVKIGQPGSYVTYDTPWANVSNTPFRKYKRFLHEGGIITPCIVSWPGHIKPTAGYYPEPAYVTDLLPTAIELAGIRNRDLPGNSLSFLWTGKQAPVRTYYWEHEGNQAIRRGEWKLVKDREDPDWSLYNLANDPTESKDLVRANRTRADELKKLYKKWAADVGVKHVD